MSDLAATNCGCSNDNGCGCNNIIWIILLLCCCGGGCGNGNGSFLGGNGCSEAIWIILLLCCCGGYGGNNNGNGCGCFETSRTGGVNASGSYSSQILFSATPSPSAVPVLPFSAGSLHLSHIHFYHHKLIFPYAISSIIRQ